MTDFAPADTVAWKLASFAAASFAAPDRIPERVRRLAAQRFLDNIGCIVFGLRVEPVRALAEFTAALGQGRCRVIGLTAPTSAPHAALVQGILAQSFEMNDLGVYVHPGACIIPACLAAAEEGGRAIAGAQLLAAIVVGYEITVRVSECVGPGAELDIGWHTPGFHGAIGAAAAAALLLGGDVATIAEAIAIAADLAGGGLMMARLGTDTKRLHCGRGAEVGLLSALYAARGVRSRLDIMEHEVWGYCRTMAGGITPKDIAGITRGLGESYIALDRTAIKYYCVGAEVIGVIDNVNKLKSAHRFTPDEVERVEVGTPRFFHVAEPHIFPRSISEIHFNVEYGVAMALLHEVKPIHEDRAILDRWMTGFQDPRARALGARVVHVVDEELDRRNPYAIDSKVAIRLRDGRVLREETQYVRRADSKGTMQFAPMDEDKILRKFRALVHGVVAPADQDRLIADVLGLAAIDDARRLWQSLRLDLAA